MAVTDIRPGSLTGHIGKIVRIDRESLHPVAVAYLLCLIFPLFFQLGPLSMSNLRLLVLVMTVPLFGMIYAGKFGRITPTDILFPLFIGWSLVVLMRNNPEMAIQNTGSTGVEFLGGYAIGRAYVRTPAQFLQLCRWLVGIVLFLMPFAVIEALTQRLLIGETLSKIPGLGSVARNVGDKRLGLDRAQTIFVHPIHFGLFCSVVLSMAFVALKGQTSNGWRFTSSLIVLLTGFLALSSGALLAMVLFCGLAFWSVVFRTVKVRWWLLLAAGAVAYVVIDLFSNRTPFKVFLSYATMNAHTAYWRAIILEWGMINVWQNPIFGLGFNDWVRPVFMRSGSMDNFWLVIAVRYGIPGFLLLTGGFVYTLLRVIFRNFESSPTLSQIRLAWIFTFLGLSFTLVTVHVWGSIFSFVFFMFGCGVWLMHYQPESAETAAVEAEPDARRGTAFSRFGPGERPEAKPEASPAPTERATPEQSLETARKNRMRHSRDL